MAPATFELPALALAWSAALLVRPWRLLRPYGPAGALATPLLAMLALLPWLWAWPALFALPLPLHWSTAPLAVLMLGWPLAIPVLTFAGMSTMLTVGASWNEALALTVWSGVLPATLVLVLGHVVRRTCGPHPFAYLLGRAFLVPLVALAACGLAGEGMPGTGVMQTVAVLLLATGEASWTCAIVTLLVACRPQWLATWSDAVYLPRPAPAPVPTRAAPRRR